MLTAALVGCQSLPVFPCWFNRSTQHRRQISLLGFQIARSHVVVRLTGEPTCKLALHYRELGDDMRKVIATKTPPTPEKHVDGDVLPGAPDSRWATFPFDRGFAQVLQQKPTALNRCRDF